AQHDLAARRAGSAAFERRMRGAPRRHLAGEEVLEARAALDQLAGRGAEPVGQRLVDEKEAAVAVDRVETRGCVVEEVGELHLLVADHLLHLVARGDVLEAPQAVAGPPGEQMRREAEPGGAAGAVAQRQATGGAAAARGILSQAQELARR